MLLKIDFFLKSDLSDLKHKLLPLSLFLAASHFNFRCSPRSPNLSFSQLPAPSPNCIFWSHTVCFARNNCSIRPLRLANSCLLNIRIAQPPPCPSPCPLVSPPTSPPPPPSPCPPVRPPPCPPVRPPPHQTTCSCQFLSAAYQDCPVVNFLLPWILAKVISFKTQHPTWSIDF